MVSLNKTETIIISRTDSLGDVILTLPMTGVLKKYKPNVKIVFLAKTYSKPLIDACEYVDEFINYDELSKKTYKQQVECLKELEADVFIHVYPNKYLSKLAKKAQIPTRIGTSHRLYHLFTCNKILNIGRKKSDLHESQLNIKLLSPLNVPIDFDTNDLYKFYGFTQIKPLKKELEKLLDEKKFNLILHPKSKGSAREWGISNFQKLIDILPKDKFKIFISGTANEAELMKDFLQKNKDKVIDITGKMSLNEFISFISKADGLVAASTGPLHIAAACRIKAIGIYAPMRPIHPGRWKPIGEDAHFLVQEEYCEDCKKTGVCHCIQDITPYQVLQKLQEKPKNYEV